MKKSTKKPMAQSRAQNYIVTAKFPNGKKIEIRAVGAAGKSKAAGMIKKHAPSAKVSVRKV